MQVTRNKARSLGTGLGILFANLVAAIIVDGFQIPLHTNILATGSVFLATLVNMLISKYWT